MKYKVELLPTAWEELKRIEDFYCLEFNPETALQVVDNILDTIERLEEFPESGSLTPDSWLNDQGFRMVICKKYVAIYRQVGDTVYIYHIANAKSEYTKLFGW
ncbi:type II toxin-antitoxin system RelE/ParE family toxin [Anaerovorax odorimutans]|uniref:Type II toxin-antitoxin system RelE/ParE family toxin n=1 Tax=Anaerovorax odorimutans TaxID=109327 RepID=A0ABT1RLX2_9FIRM|nr:type II toxin-antitoxin system RelE/ParE family toxin [Anaerovorax odorimutans]MCQ4635936.1 type II toxin-antitoxin system RelE/ParE family toxin [Anaerovorax odorimutans]